jgi:hypothetical protein
LAVINWRVTHRKKPPSDIFSRLIIIKLGTNATRSPSFLSCVCSIVSSQRASPHLSSKSLSRKTLALIASVPPHAILYQYICTIAAAFQV